MSIKCRVLFSIAIGEELLFYPLLLCSNEKDASWVWANRNEGGGNLKSEIGKILPLWKSDIKGVCILHSALLLMLVRLGKLVCLLAIAAES